MTDSTALADRTERIDSPIYGEIMPVAAIQQNIARVQMLKKEVLKEGTDFGVIPGTQKPSLYKPGAELVNLMFGVSVDPDAAALRDEEGVDEMGLPFYRCTVRMVLKTRGGIFLGASYGSASSLEAKYKWRRATGPKEFAATVDGRKRSLFKRGKNNTEYEELQVRTEMEDIKNTILQMAMKRAEVSGTKRVHALSGMFGQDLEDLPAEIRDSIIEEELVADAKAPVQPGQRKSQQATPETKPASETKTNDDVPTPTGQIVSVDEKTTQHGKTYYAVKLSTGYTCSTWSRSIAQEAATHQSSGAVVTLVTEQKDPKFPPTLKGITVVEGKAEPREPGMEG